MPVRSSAKLPSPVGYATPSWKPLLLFLTAELAQVSLSTLGAPVATSLQLFSKMDLQSILQSQTKCGPK